ncbi:DgyrCDS2081 [Dimorphilus gyrociliatus]|uniref:DgyrCDS2081 n=1 Tax=Dimorphilus gyrociliatus TaxID=2664684 RepID=A0A7I8V9E1_9ANNE|nr:DgyrCDS2081 [Dimorphilus gyrociliatus]
MKFEHMIKKILKFKAIGLSIFGKKTKMLPNRLVNLRLPLLRFSQAINIRRTEQRAKHAGAENDNPVNYTSSPAHSHKSYDTFFPQQKYDRPWYQPISVLVSTAAFLIYFLVLREENDLDDRVQRSLYEHFPSMEESQLKTYIDYEKEKGGNVDMHEKRLSEFKNKK